MSSKYRFESDKKESEVDGLFFRTHVIHFPSRQEHRFSLKVMAINVKDLRSANIDAEKISPEDLTILVERSELYPRLQLIKRLGYAEQPQNSNMHKYQMDSKLVPIYLPDDNENQRSRDETSYIPQNASRQDLEEIKRAEQEKKRAAEEQRAKEEAILQSQAQNQTSVPSEQVVTENYSSLSGVNALSTNTANYNIRIAQTTEPEPPPPPPTNQEVLAVMEQATFQTNTLPDNVVYFNQLTDAERFFLADWPHYIDTLGEATLKRRFQLEWNLPVNFNLNEAYENVVKDYVQFKHDGDVIQVQTFNSKPPGITSVYVDWNEIYFQRADLYSIKSFSGYQSFEYKSIRESQQKNLISTPGPTDFYAVPKIGRKTLALRTQLLQDGFASNLDESGNPVISSGRGVSASVKSFQIEDGSDYVVIRTYINGFSLNVKYHSLSYFSKTSGKFVNVLGDIKLNKIPDLGNGTEESPIKPLTFQFKVRKTDIASGKFELYHDLYFDRKSQPVRNVYQVDCYLDQQNSCNVTNTRSIRSNKAIEITISTDAIPDMWFPSDDAIYASNPYLDPNTVELAGIGVNTEPRKVLYLEITRTNGIDSDTFGPFILNAIQDGEGGFQKIPQKNNVFVKSIDPANGTIVVEFSENYENLEKFKIRPQQRSTVYDYIIRPSIVTLGVDYCVTTGEPVTVNKTSESNRRYFYDVWSAEHPAKRYGYSVPPFESAIKNYVNLFRYARYGTAAVVKSVEFADPELMESAKFVSCELKYLRGAGVESDAPETLTNDFEEVTFKEYTYNEYIHPFNNIQIEIPYSLAKHCDRAVITGEIYSAPFDGWQDGLAEEYWHYVPTDSNTPCRKPYRPIILSDFFPTPGKTTFVDFTFPFWAQYIHDFFLSFAKSAYPVLAEEDFYVGIRYKIRFYKGLDEEGNPEEIETGYSSFDFDLYDRTDMIKSSTYRHVIEKVDYVTSTRDGKDSQQILAEATSKESQEQVANTPLDTSSISNLDGQGASGTQAYQMTNASTLTSSPDAITQNVATTSTGDTVPTTPSMQTSTATPTATTNTTVTNAALNDGTASSTVTTTPTTTATATATTTATVTDVALNNNTAPLGDPPNLTVLRR